MLRYKKNVIAGATVALVGVLCIVKGVMSHSNAGEESRIASVKYERITVDERFDAAQDSALVALLAPYKERVDSLMSPVVGRTARQMQAYRPESELSNLLADVLVWAAKQLGETVDFAIYNMGGIRAALPEGDVTKGDVLDVAPFENKICFLTLSGEATKHLFENIAAAEGEGVSAAVRMQIGSDGTLAGITLGGKDIDAAGSYRVATLDYLAQGNDGLVAFKEATDVVAMQGSEYNVRDLIEAYFQTAAAEGRKVDSAIEGRITSE